jgi:hypothetical protein
MAVVSCVFSLRYWCLLLGFIRCTETFCGSLVRCRFSFFLYSLFYVNAQYPVDEIVNGAIPQISSKGDGFSAVLSVVTEQLCSGSFCAQRCESRWIKNILYEKI